MLESTRDARTIHARNVWTLPYRTNGLFTNCRVEVGSVPSVPALAASFDHVTSLPLVGVMRESRSQDAGKFHQRGYRLRKDGIAERTELHRLLLKGYFSPTKSPARLHCTYIKLYKHVCSSSQPPIPCRYDLRLPHADIHLSSVCMDVGEY